MTTKVKSESTSKKTVENDSELMPESNLQQDLDQKPQQDNKENLENKNEADIEVIKQEKDDGKESSGVGIETKADQNQ